MSPEPSLASLMAAQEEGAEEFRYGWSGHTDRGRVRKNNEDCFLGLAVDGEGAHFLGKLGEAGGATADLVFAVSDGMGGAMAGEFASKIAVEKITRMLPPLFRQNAVGITAGHTEVVEELFGEIHKALQYLGDCYEECAGMGATLSLCWFAGRWMYFGHIGDSRIYYLPAAGGIKQLTRDDTHVGWLFRKGEINEREARAHPRRNVLQAALGAGHMFVNPQVGAVGVEAGDRFLLCTDGVTDGFFTAQIPDTLLEGGYAADHLVAEAVRRSGRDNATAMVVSVLPAQDAASPGPPADAN